MKKNELTWHFWAVIFFVTVGTIVYVWDVFDGKVETPVATWVVLIIASVLNLAVVVMKDGLSALRLNIVIIMGLIGQVVCLGAVMINDASTDIRQLDVLIVIVALTGFAIFLWRREHAILGAVIINMSIVIGFIPMWIHLSIGGVTESVVAWVCITIAASIGSLKLYSDKKYLAFVYPMRATLTSGSVVVLTLWNIYL